jgi:tRNA(fMet)-specific endonuclease VapC
MNYLLDTNILTAVIKENKKILNKLRQVNYFEQEVFISCITYYESKRGLIYSNATRQLFELHQFSTQYQILFLDNMEIIEKACEIHRDLKRKGTSVQDADILIAATAIVRELILVSNDFDMLRIDNIRLENWLSEV